MVKFPLKALSGGFAASSPRGRAKLEAQQPDKHPFSGAFGVRQPVLRGCSVVLALGMRAEVFRGRGRFYQRGGKISYVQVASKSAPWFG